MKTPIQTCCRACGSAALTPLFSLGQDDTYVMCDPAKDAKACGLVQRALTSEVADREPATPTTQTHKHRLRSLVAEVMEMLSTRDGHALDIGCGDGTLMAQYPRWIEPVGVDQGGICQKNPQAQKIQTGKFPSKPILSSLKAKVREEGFDVITCVDSFAETQDAKNFLASVKSLMAFDGIFVLETPYLSLALMRNDLGQFHERAQAIYSLSVLEKLARAVNLKIVRGSMTETSGGSLRLFFAHADYDNYDFVPWLDQLARLWDEETALNLVSRQPYQAMLQRVESARPTLEFLIRDMHRHGEHAHVIGADSRMSKTLEIMGLTSETISAIVETNSTSSSATMRISAQDDQIEIISDEESRMAPPDIYFAPASRKREVLESWRDQIFGGARIVFLTPEYEVVSRENYSTALGTCLAVTDAPGSVETLRSVLSAVRRPRLVAVNTALKA